MKNLKLYISTPLIALLFALCSSESTYAQPLTWEKFYTNDVAYGVSRIDDTTFYLCGAKNNTCFIMKINQYGNVLWQRQFSDSSVNWASTILTTEDYGCIISGYYYGAFTAKYDVNGNLVWRKTYSSGGEIVKMIHGDDDGYYLCGRSSIIKIDREGDFIWKKNFNSPDFWLYDLCFDPISNNILSVGAIYNSLLFGYIIKIDNAGSTIFEKTFKILRQGTNCTHIEKYKNDYFISGSTFDSGAAYPVNYLLRINSSGDSLYKKILPSTREETIGSLFIKNESTLFFSTRNFSDSVRIKLFSTDTLGNIVNAKTLSKAYDCRMNDGISLSSNYNVYVGYMDVINDLIWVIKTDNFFNFVPVGITNNNSLVENFSLSQNYPNPFNPVTNIKYSLPKTGLVSIKIYDVVGRMVKELVSEVKETGIYSVAFNGSQFASGVYFYRFETGSFSDTKRMVLVK